MGPSNLWSLFQERGGPVSAALAILGLLSTLKAASGLLGFILLYLRPSKLSRYLHTTDGRPAWALVTGASDGIGKQFAHELAAAGFNVAIHGRNPTKLAVVREELEREFPERGFRVVVADAGAIACVNCYEPSPAATATATATATADSGKIPLVDFKGIAASLADVNLTLLINNAGGNMYSPTYQWAQDVPQQNVMTNINVNAVFPFLLQAALIPQLARAGPALIMNIGSLSDNGLPMLSSYVAAKVFGTAAVRVLEHEFAMQEGLADRGLAIMVVRVGEVCGTTHNQSRPHLFQPDSRTMARAALGRIGCGRTVVVGYLPHALQNALVGVLPGWLRDRAIKNVIIERWEKDLKNLKGE